MELFVIVFNSIFPVFFIILLGFWLFKIEFINVETQKGLNRLAYWVALPAFLFFKIANAKLEMKTVGNLFTSVLLGTLFAMLLGYVLSRIFKASRASSGASVQASGRGNQAFIALPIVIYTIDQLAPDRAEILVDSVVLVLSPLVIIYNLICVTVMIIHSSKESENLKKDIIKGLYTNPLIIACVSGLLWNYFEVDLSKGSAIFRSCEAIGLSAFPMALLGVGSQLAQIHIKGHINWALCYSSIKTIVAPLAGFGIACLLGMDRVESVLAMIMLTTPTAVAAYVLADQLECDPDITASTIMISTIMSFFTFSAILLIF